jgi:hypothetical protein
VLLLRDVALKYCCGHTPALICDVPALCVCVRKLCCYAAKFERAAKLNSLRGDWIAGYANLSAAGPKVVSVFFTASSSLAGRIAEEGKSREAHEFIAQRALLHRLDSQLPQNVFRK